MTQQYVALVELIPAQPIALCHFDTPLEQLCLAAPTAASAARPGHLQSLSYQESQDIGVCFDRECPCLSLMVYGEFGQSYWFSSLFKGFELKGVKQVEQRGQYDGYTCYECDEQDL